MNNATQDSQRPIVQISSFRAIDAPHLCERFIEGHRRVLEIVGVKEVTSANHEWVTNPAVFVILVESIDGSKTYGGARVHTAGGSQPLPIESATYEMDPEIINMVKRYAKNGTGEICGLWNSREVAGLGIGSVFLIRAAVAISKQIGLNSLFALCAPYTIKMAENVGYTIETSIGNNGTFYYPKIDLLATAMILKDVDTLSKASCEEKIAIEDLRINPIQVKLEILRKKELEIHYKLKIPNIETWHYSQVLNFES